MSRHTEKIVRTRLSSAYIENMADFLSRTRGIPITEARAFAIRQVADHLTPPNFHVVETIKPGCVEERTYGLREFLDIIHDKVVTPSGSVFYPTNIVRSIISILVGEFKSERKGIKGKMFKAVAARMGALVRMYDSIQSSIKVVLNSLPGSFGYASSIFYDKGCYNAVTSCGRMLISNSFICCEQFLGGNLVIYDEAEAINHLVLISRMCRKNVDKIASVIHSHDLKSVTRDQVVEYYNKSLKRYSLTGDLSTNKDFTTILASLPDELVQFAWYGSNMHHLVFGNSDKFHAELSELLDKTTVEPFRGEMTREMFFKLDSGILAVATTMLATQVKGRATAEIAENDKLCRLVSGAYYRLKRYQDSMEDLFDVFIYHDIGFQKIMTRNKTQRECVVVSDTDSVIFTAMAWSEWYTKQSDSLNHDSYCIGALATYWLNLANMDTMAKFAIGVGAVGADIHIIDMKSEFMYPAMLLFDIKKVYASLMASREGVMLDGLVPDLKGAAIRGVGASPRAREFITEVLVDDVLTPAISGKMNANELIAKVVKFEGTIKRSLQQGGMDFVPIVSVNPVDSYKKPNSSVYFNCLAWNEIFGESYDFINPPNKLPLLKLIPPTEYYFKWLEEHHPETHVRFSQFVEKYGKVPGGMFLPLSIKRIPKELAPIINTRDIVYFNVSPIYMTLNSLNIGAGFSKQHVLLNEIYKV